MSKEKTPEEISSEQLPPSSSPEDREVYNSWIKVIRAQNLELEKRNYEIRQNSIEGKGTYTKRDFRVGDVISHYLVGRYEDIRKTSEIEPGSDFDKYAIQCGIDKSGEGLYVSIIDDNPRRYINHSCEPNVGIKRRPRPEGGWDSDLIAIKEIKIGEEITLDYSTTQLEEWSMKRCRCGSKSCRHEITDFARLAPDLQDKYIKQGIIPDWMSSTVGK